MELMIKEAIGGVEYDMAMEKFKDDPEINNKPDYEIRRCILRIPYSSILLYKILETGDIETDKKEIKILTSFGPYYCDYKKEVHKYLKDIMDKIEKQVDISYEQGDIEDK